MRQCKDANEFSEVRNVRERFGCTAKGEAMKGDMDSNQAKSPNAYTLRLCALLS